MNIPVLLAKIVSRCMEKQKRPKKIRFARYAVVPRLEGFAEAKNVRVSFLARPSPSAQHNWRSTDRCHWP